MQRQLLDGLAALHGLTIMIIGGLKSPGLSPSLGGSIVMGVPPIAGWFIRENHGKSPSKMDVNWGYPYFRKPPMNHGRLLGSEAVVHKNDKMVQQ